MEPIDNDPRETNIEPTCGRHVCGDSPSRTQTSLDAWIETSMRNMKRMAADEEYRLAIAQFLS